MSVTFTKLFSSITASTIWAEPDHTRLVWITMLAMSDHHGRVWASIPGLANMARVSLERCEEALVALSSPDKYSRTKDYEGRRIEEMDGGWRLLNHEKYRALRDQESIKESKRRYINERRAAEREAKAVESVEQSRTQSKSVDRCRANTEADTEAEVEKTSSSKAATRPKAKAGKKCPDDFVVSDELLAWASEKTSMVNINAETDAFRDWTFSTARVDWDGTWRNWMRKAQKDAEQRGGKRPAVSFKKSDDARLAERVREMTGGIVSPSNQGEVIDMEATNGFRRIETSG